MSPVFFALLLINCSYGGRTDFEQCTLDTYRGPKLYLNASEVKSFAPYDFIQCKDKDHYKYLGCSKKVSHGCRIEPKEGDPIYSATPCPSLLEGVCRR